MNYRNDAENKTTRTITMPDRLWEFLKSSAARDHRSVNAQLTALVEREAEAQAAANA